MGVIIIIIIIIITITISGQLTSTASHPAAERCAGITGARCKKLEPVTTVM